MKKEFLKVNRTITIPFEDKEQFINSITDEIKFMGFKSPQQLGNVLKFKGGYQVGLLSKITIELLEDKAVLTGPKVNITKQGKFIFGRKNQILYLRSLIAGTGFGLIVR